jgi:hypothetical protein
VTVTDNELPVIVCPANISVTTAPGDCDAVVSYTAPVGSDNCPGVVTTQTAGLGSGSTFTVGTSTETYTATDASGNIASCSFTITVTDGEAPVITCQTDTLLASDPGICGAVFTYAVPTATDNCPGVTVSQISGPASGSSFPVGATLVTFVAVDAAGNADTCSFTVTIQDNVAPSIVCPANILVNNDPGACDAVVTFVAPVGTDNCPGASTTQLSGGASGSTFALGISTLTYVVTDGGGLTDTCSFTVTVVDAEAPVITCPANITVSNDPGQCSAVVTYTAPVGTDNCPGSVTVQTGGLGSGSTFVVGTSNEVFTVTDAAGNSANCTFTITVNDVEAPEITCPATLFVNNDPGQCGATVTYTTPVFTDNCVGASASLPTARAF